MYLYYYHCKWVKVGSVRAISSFSKMLLATALDHEKTLRAISCCRKLDIHPPRIKLIRDSLSPSFNGIYLRLNLESVAEFFPLCYFSLFITIHYINKYST